MNRTWSFRKYIKNIFGILKSLYVSLRVTVPYLFGIGDSRKEVTENYPDPTSSKTPEDLPLNVRGILYNDIDLCTGCGECAEVCPVKCIHIETEPGPQLGKKWVSVFDIDLRKCIHCGFCTDVCAPNSLMHTNQFESASYFSKDLVLNFGRGHVSPVQKKRWNLLNEE